VKNVKLIVYTRPTCSDCQESKRFLTKNNVKFTEYDLSQTPSKEEDLIKISGTRIVPAFVFEKKSLLGMRNKSKVVIGFERNMEEIKRLLEF
jgi:glutaredoxin